MKIFFTTILLSACLTGCGRSGGVVGSVAKMRVTTEGVHGSAANATSQAISRPDTDKDNLGSSYYDEDDGGVLAYGQDASQADTHEVTVLMDKYHVAAAKGDGAAGCSLLYSLVAESVVEEVEGEDARSSARRATCPKVLAKLFKQGHRQLATARRLRVTGVRVSGERGYALLGAGSIAERYQFVHREAGTWKVAAIVDEGLP